MPGNASILRYFPKLNAGTSDQTASLSANDAGAPEKAAASSKYDDARAAPRAAASASNAGMSERATASFKYNDARTAPRAAAPASKYHDIGISEEISASINVSLDNGQRHDNDGASTRTAPSGTSEGTSLANGRERRPRRSAFANTIAGMKRALIDPLAEHEAPEPSPAKKNKISSAADPSTDGFGGEIASTVAQAKEKANPVSSSQMTSGEADRGEPLASGKESIDSVAGRSQPQPAESSKKRALRSTKNIAASNEVPSKRAKSGKASACRPESTNKDADGDNVDGVIDPVVPLVSIGAEPVAPRRSSRSAAANATARIKDSSRDSMSSAVEAEGLPPTPPSIPRPKAGSKAKGKAKAPAIDESTLVDDVCGALHDDSSDDWVPQDEEDESVIPDQLILGNRSLIDKLPLDSDDYLDDSDDTLEEFDEPLDESDENLGELDKEDGSDFLDTNDDSFIPFEDVVDEADDIEIDDDVIAADTRAQLDAALWIEEYNESHPVDPND
ncbi:hypothetical protein TsFJ059_005114, partial [Trichoderma semiorbis]